MLIFILSGMLFGWLPINPANILAQSDLTRLPLKACSPAKNLIVLLGDGMGDNQRLAARQYSGDTPTYQSWTQYWVSTYPAGGSYDPNQAWSNFDYIKTGWTDSAAAATALFTGVKTDNIRISVSEDGSTRLTNVAEKAHDQGKAVGAVTTVQISHATPAAWLAHNDSRNNGFAIADESLWGDPNTTGNFLTSIFYSGAHGDTIPPVEVIIGAGHPNWNGGNYVNFAMRDKLASESGLPGAFTFVERLTGYADGGNRLLDAADNPTVLRLAGLFGGTSGNLEYRLADGSGASPENPTLAQMAQAALTVLNRDSDGFVLLIEGGAIDKAAHDNKMNEMIGEVVGFNEAVQAVIDWIDEPDNNSDWTNTLVIITADHETGYLSRSPGAYPNQPLGDVNATTLAMEKTVLGAGRRASWQDLNTNNLIDPQETVYWSWNSGGHTNSLIPLFAKGAGAELFSGKINPAYIDPVRRAFLDNTDVFNVLERAGLGAPCPASYAVYLPTIIQKLK